MEMFGCLFCGQNEGNNEPIETQDLSENQNEDHAHKKPWLLSCAPHACVAHNANCEACRQPTEAHAQPSSQIEETPKHTETSVSQHRGCWGLFDEQVIWVNDLNDNICATVVKHSCMQERVVSYNWKGKSCLKQLLLLLVPCMILN